MARKLVSVLLPCGALPYAVQTRAIPSLIAQTHRNWELIVVSQTTNNTAMRAAVAAFSDTRIRYDEVAGHDHAASASCRYARALNRAQELATGDVLGLLDDEAQYLPRHLHESLDALHSSPADLVHGRVTRHDPNTGRQMESDNSIIYASSVCYSAKWQDDRFSEDAEDPLSDKWFAMLGDGASFVRLSTPQSVTPGDEHTARVRVSMPSLPPTDRLHTLVDEIAVTRQLSNNGPMNSRLEAALAAYLDVPHVVTAASGDTALG